MTATIRVTLPYPPSANAYWRVGPRGLYVSEEAKEYKARVARLLEQCRPLVGDVELTGVFYRPRKSGDLSNRLKVLEDAMNGRAFLDDKQIHVINIRRDDTQPERARVELVLGGLGFATVDQVAAFRTAAEATTKKRRATVRLNRKVKEGLAAGRVRLSPASYPSTK
jgi:crossover junction endodeoxyribonuclease RusA